jgi:hypothetical protein
MNRIPNEFSQQTVAVLPITRLLFDTPFRVGPYYFFPPGEFDVQSMNPISSINLEDHRIDSETIRLEGNSLRMAKSAIAGLSIDILESNPLVVFTTNIDWGSFDSLDHDGRK